MFDLGGVFFDWKPEYFYKNVFSSKEELKFFIRPNRDKLVTANIIFKSSEKKCPLEIIFFQLIHGFEGRVKKEDLLFER